MSDTTEPTTSDDPNAEAVEKYQQGQGKAMRRDHMPEEPGLNQQAADEKALGTAEAADEVDQDLIADPPEDKSQEEWLADQPGPGSRDA